MCDCGREGEGRRKGGTGEGKREGDRTGAIEVGGETQCKRQREL